MDSLAENQFMQQHLTIQPEVLIGLAYKRVFRGRGLLARFLFVVPKSPLGNRKSDPPPVPDYIRQAYRNAVLSIARIPFQTSESGQIVPYVLEFTPDAKEAWLAFSEEIEPSLGDGGNLEFLNDWAGKLPGAVARISGLLHMMAWAGTEGWRRSVERKTVEAAIQIGRYLIPHARAAVEMVRADEDTNLARWILDWIRRKRLSRFSQRGLHQDAKRQVQKSSDLEPALQVLVDRSYLRRRVDDRPGPGRKPSPVFLVNPIILHPSEIKIPGNRPQNPQNQTAEPSEPYSGDSGDSIPESEVGSGVPARREALQP